MAVVYANDPSAAFAASSALDQNRVGNFLNSIAANRQAQLQGWQAAQQIAAARQAQEAQQQNQMLQLAHLAVQSQSEQQRRQEQAAQLAASMGFSRDQLAELTRHNMAGEGRENASLLAFREKQKQDEEALNEEAQHQSELAKQLNARNALSTLKARLEDPASQDAALKSATGAGFSPAGDPAYSNKWFFHGPSKASRTAEVMQGIASDASGVPADFSGANSISDYTAAALKAINTQLLRLPNPTSIKNLHTMLTQDDAGNYQPLLRLNPLLSGGAPTSAPAQTQPPATTTRQAQLVAEAEDAIRKGADPAKVGARLAQLLKGAQ